MDDPYQWSKSILHFLYCEANKHGQQKHSTIVKVSVLCTRAIPDFTKPMVKENQITTNTIFKKNHLTEKNLTE